MQPEISNLLKLKTAPIPGLIAALVAAALSLQGCKQERSSGQNPSSSSTGAPEQASVLSPSSNSPSSPAAPAALTEPSPNTPAGLGFAGSLDIPSTYHLIDHTHTSTSHATKNRNSIIIVSWGQIGDQTNQLLAVRCENMKKPSRPTSTTYFHQAESWCVASGYLKSSLIYYTKYLVEGERWAEFTITFDERDKSTYSPLVGPLQKSLKIEPQSPAELEAALAPFKESPGASGPFPAGFKQIHAGKFLMGSPAAELGRVAVREAQREVTLTRGFWLGETEVTQRQYLRNMRVNPSENRRCGLDCPVDNVSWYEAIRYTNQLSEAQGLPACYDDQGEPVAKGDIYSCEGYRLPTEAEWEYAARAGTETATYAGNITAMNCKDTTLPEIAWVCGRRTHPAAQKGANAWGLYDMLGNVAEWASDKRVESLGSSPATDPVGPSIGQYRIFRGGGVSHSPPYVRAAYRGHEAPDYSANILGFRVARSVISE